MKARHKAFHAQAELVRYIPQIHLLLLVVYLQQLQEILMYLLLAFKKRPPVKGSLFVCGAFSTDETQSGSYFVKCVLTSGMYISIKRKFRPPISIFSERGLFFFLQHTRLERQRIHLRPHKAAIAVFGRANYRLAAHVEAPVDDHRAAGLPPKRLDDLPVEWAHLAPHGLNSGGIIHVRDSGYLRPRDVELLYAPQSLFFLGHPAAALLDHVGDQKHIWAVGIHLEPLRDMLSK